MGPVRNDGVCISAVTGDGIENLLEKLEQELSKKQVRISILVPYSKYDVLELIRRNGTILSEEHETDGTRVEALVLEGDTWKIRTRLDS